MFLRNHERAASIRSCSFVFFLLIRFSVLPHRKAEAVRTVRRQHEFFMDWRSPAVVAAYAHLFVVYAQDGFIAWRELVRMVAALEFLRRPRQGAQLHEGGAEPQTFPATFGEAREADIRFVSAFLRSQIRNELIGDSSRVSTDFGSRLSVPIIIMWPRPYQLSISRPSSSKNSMPISGMSGRPPPGQRFLARGWFHPGRFDTPRSVRI